MIKAGKKPVDTPNLSNAEIDLLNTLGFVWTVFSKKDVFQKRIEELKEFKAEFGHCNIRISNSPAYKSYVSLAKWCSKIRSRRRLFKLNLSDAQIQILDDLGFSWSRRKSPN